MIEFRHLRYFIAVAEELSFRRAAERVHIDQTPLSRAIRDLEDQLGVQMFVRAPRKLRLLKEARKVFIRIKRAYRAVRETDARFRAPLRIGVADGIAQPTPSECLTRWREVAPEIPIELTEMRALASAWMAVFSSTLNTAACCGALRYSPITSAALASKSGSLEAR
jgi:DNA-binding transcriptional LysR family regulator